MRVSLIATHPIQYQAPWFRLLARAPGVDLTVHFASIPSSQAQGIGFGVEFQWDVPLTEGYRWERLKPFGKGNQIRSFFSTLTRGMTSSLKAARPDAVIVTGWNSATLVQALFSTRRLRVPCLVRGESTAMRTRPFLVRFLHRELLRRYDGFLVIGTRNREFYEGYGVDPRKMFSCPYFIDNDLFRTSADAARPRREELRRGWGIPADAVCFLFAGKLQPIKRCFDLLRACEIAAKQNRRVHVLVVGAGEEEEAARRFVAERDLPVSFAGFLNQTKIPEAYAVSDCLVLPSQEETWGLVVNEAMACGIPAIVSDGVGCGPDLVIDRQTGWLFPTGDVEALAAAMIDCAGGERHAREMGERAEHRVRENYNATLAVAGTLQALRSVISG